MNKDSGGSSMLALPRAAARILKSKATPLCATSTGVPPSGPSHCFAMNSNSFGANSLHISKGKHFGHSQRRGMGIYESAASGGPGAAAYGWVQETSMMTQTGCAMTAMVIEPSGPPTKLRAKNKAPRSRLKPHSTLYFT